MQIKLKRLTETAKTPERMSKGAAGFDIYADIRDVIVIKPMQRALIPTGLSLALPHDFEAQIRTRSGMAIKHGISVLNSPGTIDSDYRGEIMVILINFSDTDFVIRPSMRIAQMVIAKHETVDFDVVELLDVTERGSGGFGHTE